MFDSVPAVKTKAQLKAGNVARGIGILSGDQTKALVEIPKFTDFCNSFNGSFIFGRELPPTQKELN